MARSPIEIGIASETGAFRKGVQSGIIEPLEDAQKALDDLATSRGPDGLERDMRDAQRQTEKLKDETERSADAIEREFKRAYRESKQSADDGLTGMSRKTEEVSGELKQNLGETFSSFRGDLEDLPQIAQDVFGGIAAGAGTVTASLGLAGIAGAIGLVIGGLAQAQEEQRKNEEAANDWADAYQQAGGRVLDTASIISRGQKILRDQQEDIAKNAELWGVNESTALAAMAGSQSALEEVRNSLAGMTDEMERQQNLEMQDEWAEYSSELTELQRKVYDGTASFDQMNARMDEGAAKANTWSFFLRDVANSTEGATRTVDEFGDTVVTLPDGKTIYIDAETGQATDNTNAIEQKIYGIKDKDVTVKVHVDDSAVRYYERNTTLRIAGVVIPNGGTITPGWTR